MIRKAVIPAAGLGTRLLFATKEQPKEMLPIFSKSMHSGLCLKPLLQLVFEQLFDLGVKEFYFIVGRGKRSIEDHFTPDQDYLDILFHKDKHAIATDLELFYKKIEKSTIVWVNQAEPKGFGHAVLMTKNLIGDEPFIVHAGDNFVISNSNNHVSNLVNEMEEHKADAVVTLQEVRDTKHYGIAEVKITKNGFDIVRVEEKPKRAKSKLAIRAIYVFKPTILEALKKTKPGKSNELQLTDGIQKLIDWGLQVRGIKLKRNDVCLDIGTPDTYWEALNQSFHNCTMK